MDPNVSGSGPLEELKRLDESVDQVRDLADLKPIYYRLEEIGRQHAGDFEVQLVISDIKQHLVNHGMRLKEQLEGTAGSQPPPVPPPADQQLPPTQGFRPAESVPTINIPTPRTQTPGSMPTGPQATPPQTVRPIHIPPAMEPPPQRPISGQPPMPPPPPGVEQRPIPTPQPMPTGQQPMPPQAYAPPPGQPPYLPPQQEAPPPRKQALNWKRALWIGGLGGSILSIAAIVGLVQWARKKNNEGGGGGGGTANQVQVEVVTNPPGAAIRINNETRCTSNCKINLAPGNYQVTAFLDGYEPAASGVTVAAGTPASVSLNLEPQSQTMRLLTDLDQGKVTIDAQPPADLQEGQYVLDKLASGPHTVKLVGRSGEAAFGFEVSAGKAPAVTGPLQTKNLMGVVVSSFGSQAKVYSSGGPWKLAVNGQAQGEASPAGVELKNFQPGVQEFVVGEGKDQKTMRESFGPAPLLTVFLKSDQNVGTLIISTGEDGVSVYVNDKLNPRKTERGQLRVQTIGAVTVKVTKDGFQPEPVQKATIKKGEETRLEFKLKPMPQVASLQIRGAAAGTQVLIDNRSTGVVGPDGSFSQGGVAPGDHTIELRREQFTPKKITRNFKAGDTVTLSGADVTLSGGTGTIRIQRSPADATVTWRRSDETQTHEARGTTVELPAGTYVLTARSPNLPDKTVTVQLAVGDNKTVDVSQARAAGGGGGGSREQGVRPGTMSDFEDAAGWQREGDIFSRKGGGVVLYKLQPMKGILTFTVQLVKGGGVFRSGKVRWVVDFKDGRNYALFEMDKKNFVAKDVINGKTTEREKTAHDAEKQNQFSMQIEITGDRLVHKLRKGDQWVVLDSWSQSGRNFTEGKFGFMINNNEEIAISDFRFTPTR